MQRYATIQKRTVLEHNKLGVSIKIIVAKIMMHLDKSTHAAKVIRSNIFNAHLSYPYVYKEIYFYVCKIHRQNGNKPSLNFALLY